jgi:hypothetical protein
MMVGGYAPRALIDRPMPCGKAAVDGVRLCFGCNDPNRGLKSAFARLHETS